MRKHLAVLLALLCLLFSGCDAVKDDDRTELDSIGTKTEKEQVQLAKDIKDRVEKEFQNLKFQSKEERAKINRPEESHLSRLLWAVTEVEEDGVVSQSALKRIKAALPFVKELKPEVANKDFLAKYNRAIELASK